MFAPWLMLFAHNDAAVTIEETGRVRELQRVGVVGPEGAKFESWSHILFRLIVCLVAYC